jgi:hypothetical protein
MPSRLQAGIEDTRETDGNRVVRLRGWLPRSPNCSIVLPARPTPGGNDGMNNISTRADIVSF